MQKYVAKIFSYSIKNCPLRIKNKTKNTEIKAEEQFFKQYDHAFLKSDYIQNCLKQEQLVIPVDFFQESRYDDFAEDFEFDIKKQDKQI